MAGYKLASDADADFASIYRYSIETFGERQADKYALDLNYKVRWWSSCVSCTNPRIPPATYDWVSSTSRCSR
jgi:hypothetical protein